MKIELIQTEAPRLIVTQPEPTRIEVIHRRVEVTVIDMEA